MKTNNRPEITEEKIEEIKKLLAENPDIGRSKLSVMLCEIWNWRSPNGQTKDMSCRDLLRTLEKAGKVVLPEPKKKAKGARGQPIVKHIVHDETPVTRDLKELRPLRVEIVSSKADLAQFKSYIDQYHYLGFDRFIGERMAYMVYSCDGTALACLLFGSAAWSCRDRDQYIGWNKEQRKHRLNFMTNNVRFLVLPWVRVPHLASHILSLITKRVSDDWERKYGHPVYLLETFVERRFKGTCYKAANWIHVGSTTGRGRDGGHHNAVLPIKEIYLYSLKSDYQSILCREDTDSP
ncbi:MAG TPA: Druantia anti-phage system protein DruA [Anaerovoracaceae bacterium]|nr:Druantia anti-phage system protein DruA [Anaerovoracaceae bacterium]